MSTPDRRKQYEAEFERRKISVVLDERRPINQICKELHISKKTVRKWLDRSGRVASKAVTVTSDNCEYVRKMEHDLAQALEHRGFHARNLPQQPIIFHSDQGSQYHSDNFTSTLQANNFIPRMCRKGNWYDAPMESFWSRMKAELSEHLPLRTIEYAAEVITDYIHNYYNTVPLHSAIGYIPSMEFEHNNNLLLY
jgi:transposase InsO family protein